MTAPYYEDEWVTIYNGDCREVARQIPYSIASLITSPPYAEQRVGQYGGVAESQYPHWTVEWMLSACEVMEFDASALINIRPHISEGSVSNYVLLTRIALMDAGFTECEELIWFKPGGGGPFGSLHRPRRSWESILWYGKDGRVWSDPKANGTPAKGSHVNRLSRKGEDEGYIGGHPTHIEEGAETRCLDVAVFAQGGDRGIDHPAVFPNDLARWMIRLVTKPNGVVLDPFMGSGTTIKAARDLGFKSVGIEINERYCEIAANRLSQGVLL